MDNSEVERDIAPLYADVVIPCDSSIYSIVTIGLERYGLR